MWLGIVLRDYQLFLPILLSLGSVDGVEVFVESTVASNLVKDGCVARLVLNVVVVELANNMNLYAKPADLSCCYEQPFSFTPQATIDGFVIRLSHARHMPHRRVIDND